jgi:drug/metabolite transporter (DMT)-like permease
MIYLNFFVAVMIVVLTATGQILLKLGANSTVSLIFNKYVLSGYLLFILVMFLSAVLLRSVELKYFTIIVSLNYLVATIASTIFLNEQFTKNKLIACVLISVGAAIFAL